MALLEVQDSTRDGSFGIVDATDPAVAASATGDRFVNTGKELLLVCPVSKGGPVEVTCETTIEIDGQAVADNVVSVADDSATLIGPFPISDYGTEVQISYDDEADVFVQVIRVTPGG